MNGVTNEDIRDLLTKEDLKLMDSQPGISELNWERIQSIIDVADTARTKSSSDAAEHLDRPISMSNFVIVCHYFVSFGLFTTGDSSDNFYSNKPEENIFPSDWLDQNSKPNPNFVLLQIFCQISNIAASLVHLCEIGQDNSARILLRTFDEFWQLALIISMNKEDFMFYSVNRDSDYTTTMFKHFTKKKREAKIFRIEKSLGFDQLVIDQRRAYRSEGFERFSAPVHGAPLSTLVGSLIWSFTEDIGKVGLVGGCNRLSISTLDYFLRISEHNLSLFFKILEDVHGFSYPQSRLNFWNTARRMSTVLSQSIEKMNTHSTS